LAACQNEFLPDNKSMSAQENWDDVLPSREVEQEKLDILVADTWEKLGPSPEVYPPQRRDALPRQTITVKLPT
jgi:hypothetical protein